MVIITHPVLCCCHVDLELLKVLDLILNASTLNLASISITEVHELPRASFSFHTHTRRQSTHSHPSVSTTLLGLWLGFKVVLC